MINSAQKIKKDKTALVTDYYNTPKTSLVIFHFEPAAFESSEERLKTASIQHASIDNKDLYIFDNYLGENERRETTKFFEKMSYSRYSYSTLDSEEKGEKPGYSMNTKERWTLFSNPPPAIHEVHKLLSHLSFHLNAEITIAPWELCHVATAVSPSVIINYHTEVSHETMSLGRHRDSHPEKGVFFAIPTLYKENREPHSLCFENGAAGKPWLVSMMLYSASESFLPEYRLGTVFYKDDGESALTTECKDGRFVLFEGDIFHSVEASDIPPQIKPWRISYVLKLVINPRTEKQNVKRAFKELLKALP